MFVGNLSKPQQESMLFLANMIVNADNNLTPEEATMLQTLKNQCEEAAAPSETRFSDLSAVFDSSASKASLLLELIGLAYADEEYHKSEKALISEISAALNVDPFTLKEMENWVVRQFILASEAQIFMED